MTLLTVVLFIFWIILSGKFDAFHLTLGALSAAATAGLTRKLTQLPPRTTGIYDRTWRRWPLYLPWLLWQIVLSAVQVARVVLHPRLPIAPRLIRFRCRLPNAAAHLTLANSITLTPGTVTLNLVNEQYTIHALTREAGEALTPAAGEGEMQAKVAELFSDWRANG